MVPFIAMLITGLLLGYLVIGPFNRGYTALEWSGVVLVCASAYGVLIIVALSLTTPTRPLDFVQVAIASGFAVLYALSTAIGVYVQQWRKKRAELRRLLAKHLTNIGESDR